MTGADIAPAVMRYDRTLRSSDGVQLVWHDYGPADARTVLLCHGLAASGEQFDADALFFARQGFRVIVPDLRGHGQSGKPLTEDGYAIDRMARDIVEILDASGAQRVDYVGNSLGGILALHLLATAPQRFRTLATFGTAPALGLPSMTSHVIPLAYQVAGRGLVGKLTARNTTSNLDARRLVEKIVTAFDPQVGRAVGRAVSRYDLGANLKAHQGPVLIIRGGRDIAVNRALDKGLRRMGKKANVELLDLAQAGHCANLDDPDAVRSALMDFWARH